jgi:two-component system response regulator PilR (NtrC family)
LKALVIEDEPAISRILVRKLKKIGYTVDSTDSLVEAKKLLSGDKPELLFLDYVLVDGRSQELASEGFLDQVSQIFLMSAFMDDLEKEDFKALNVTFLKKPFRDLDEVFSNLEACV